jgi:L-seryl-tRNA(Ser) seleniumtransferase
MIAARPTDLARRARAVALRLSASGVPADVVETRSTIGGGSLPEETQASHAVALGATAGAAARSAAARLRSARPAIVARIVDDRVALDLRAILPEDDELLAATTIAAMNEKG